MDTSYYLHPQGGLLTVSGPDQIVFLQRQTTNDVRLLKPGKAILTIMTSPNARILDVLHLISGFPLEGALRAEPAAIWLITLPGKGSETFRFLKSRIFFMDKVTIEDHSTTTVQVDLFGPSAADTLQKLGLNQALSINELGTLSVENLECLILALEPVIGLGYRLLIPIAVLGSLQSRLDQLGCKQLTEDKYESARVEAGVPAAGHELIERYTPLECGLRSAISDSKGCYTGQEVIARQITYDKVTQTLCGLASGVLLEQDSELRVDDRPVGFVTSAAQSEKLGPIGLAVIKHPYHLQGTRLKAGVQDVVVRKLL